MVLSGVWNLDYARSFGYADMFLKGWTMSGIVTYQSGQPYSALVNTDLNTDQNGRNDRAPGFERNTFNLPITSRSIRASRKTSVWAADCTCS